MGGVITLAPVDPIPSGRGWRTHLGAGIGSGSATGATYLADSSDTTYIHDTVAGAGDTLVLLDFANITTLPAGAAIKSVTPRVRASQAAGAKGLAVRAYRNVGSDGTAAYASPSTTIVPNATIKDFVAASGGSIPNRVPNNVVMGSIGADDYLDTLRVEIKLAGGGKANEDHRVYKVSVDVAYVDPPTVDSLALLDPTDVSSTVRPRFLWNYASDDGFPQYEFRTAVWALADINAFPGGRAAFEADPENFFADDSGQWGALGPGYLSGSTWVRAKAWSVPAGGSGAGWVQSTEPLWTSQQDLPTSGAMVAYVQSAAQFEGYRLEGPSFSSVDFTMDLVPPLAPTSVAAVWQYPEASASADRNFYYRSKITVAVPAGSIGAFSGRRLYVEHCIDGKNDWRLMPLSMQEIGASGGTFTFYDTFPLAGETLRYRARTELWTNTQTLPSAYLTGNAVDCIIDKIILRDPLRADGTVVLRLQGDLEATSGESVGEFRALGAALPTMVSDAVLGKRWKLQNLSPDELGSQSFKILRRDRATLLLQTDMDALWWWVKFGPELGERIVRQTNRKNPNKRAQFHDFELVQTYPIPGQPEIWF